MMYSLEKRLKNMEHLLQQNISGKQDTKSFDKQHKILNIETQINSHTNILNSIQKELKQLNAYNTQMREVKKQLNACNNNSHPMQCEKIMNKINKIDQKMDIIKSNQIKLNRNNENQIDTMEQLQRDTDEIQKTLILQMRSIQSVTNKMNSFTSVKQSIKSMESHLLSLKKKVVNNTMMQNISTSLHNQTDAPFPKQTLPLKNNKHDTSSQIFSNNISDIRNNNTSNKSTNACIPLKRINKSTSFHSEITSSQKTTENTLQNATPKSISTYNPSSKSIPTNASTTSKTFPILAKDATCLSKKIKNEYFPTYNPITPTLPREPTQKLLQLYYYEDEMDDEYLNKGFRINTEIMDLDKYFHLYEYQINMNLKKLARNPFSAADIIPPKHKLEQAIGYKEAGNKFYAEKRFECAIKHYRIAQKLDPTNAVYKLNESAATLMLKDYESTIRCCEDALLYTKDMKWKFKAYKRMGTAEERKGNIGKSIEYYSQAQAEKF
eukprot:239816_1